MIWQLPHAKCTYLIFRDIFQEVNKAQAIEVRDVTEKMHGGFCFALLFNTFWINLSEFW